jgi:hypothetical protein
MSSAGGLEVVDGVEDERRVAAVVAQRDRHAVDRDGVPTLRNEGIAIRRRRPADGIARGVAARRDLNGDGVRSSWRAGQEHLTEAAARLPNVGICRRRVCRRHAGEVGGDERDRRAGGIAVVGEAVRHGGIAAEQRFRHGRHASDGRRKGDDLVEHPLVARRKAQDDATWLEVRVGGRRDVGQRDAPLGVARRPAHQAVAILRHHVRPARDVEAARRRGAPERIVLEQRAGERGERDAGVASNERNCHRERAVGAVEDPARDADGARRSLGQYLLVEDLLLRRDRRQVGEGRDFVGHGASPVLAAAGSPSRRRRRWRRRARRACDWRR